MVYIDNIYKGLLVFPFRQIWLYWHNKEFGIAALRKYLVSMSLW
jgi:hypothetical protein